MTGPQPKGTYTADPLRLNGTAFAVLFASLALLACLPVLLCETLPLIDYPNHLARMHILAAMQTSPHLQRYYEIVWSPLPNLAMDLTVPALVRWMPLAWAGKAFVVTTLCLMAGGAAMLHRVLFKGWSAWPLLAFLLLYDNTLLWGLLNYLFGIGLSLFAFTLWIALRFRPRLRFATGTVLALALFFSHLLAFGLYAILAMGYEAGAILRERLRPVRAMSALLFAGATLLPPAAIYFLLTPKGDGGYIAYRHFTYKITLFFSVFDNYSLPFDVACFAVAALATCFAFWRRWVRLHPAMLMPIGCLFLAYLIMPDELATASGADRRIPLLLVLLLFACSRWTAPTPRAAHIFACAAILLFVIRMSVVGAQWMESDRLYAQLLPVLDRISTGSRVAVAAPFDTVKFPTPSLSHFPTLAVVRRDAFVPTLFAHPAQQPVAFRQHYAALASQLLPWDLWAALIDRTASLTAEQRAALANYDFVIIEALQPFYLATSPELTPIFTSPRFVLARVNSVSASR